MGTNHSFFLKTELELMKLSFFIFLFFTGNLCYERIIPGQKQKAQININNKKIQSSQDYSYIP